MKKARDLFKKTGDIKGTFHVRMDMIKDRNGKDLTEAEAIKNKWQEYTELYRKGLNDSDNHDGVVTHLEPDILECKVKWALGNITKNKASGGDGTPAELFQILKDDAVKVLYSNLEHSAVATGLEKVSFHSNPKRKAMPKKCSNYRIIALISRTSKVMLKILQARLQQYVNR